MAIVGEIEAVVLNAVVVGVPVTTYNSLLAVKTILLAAIVPAAVSIAWVVPDNPEPLLTLAVAWEDIDSENGRVINKETLLALLTILLTTVVFAISDISLDVKTPAIPLLDVEYVPSLNVCAAFPG